MDLSFGVRALEPQRDETSFGEAGRAAWATGQTPSIWCTVAVNCGSRYSLRTA